MADSPERITALRKRAKVEAGTGGAGTIVSVAIHQDSSQDWLGRSLKQLFDNIASEPIPQRIVDKLQELEQKD